MVRKVTRILASISMRSNKALPRPGTLLPLLLFVRDVIINYRHTELVHLGNNPVNRLAVIALPDMSLGMNWLQVFHRADAARMDAGKDQREDEDGAVRKMWRIPWHHVGQECA